MIGLFALLFLALLPILLFLVFIWFILCDRLFKTLEKNHPEKHKAMGKPRLFEYGPFSNSVLFTRFFLKREWRKLNDPGLTSICKAMIALEALGVLVVLVVLLQQIYV